MTLQARLRQKRVSFFASLHCLHLRDSDWFSVQSFTHSTNMHWACSADRLPKPLGIWRWACSHISLSSRRGPWRTKSRNGMGQISGWGTCRREESLGASLRVAGLRSKDAEQCWVWQHGPGRGRPRKEHGWRLEGRQNLPGSRTEG